MFSFSKQLNILIKIRTCTPKQKRIFKNSASYVKIVYTYSQVKKLRYCWVIPRLSSSILYTLVKFISMELKYVRNPFMLLHRIKLILRLQPILKSQMQLLLRLQISHLNIFKVNKSNLWLNRYQNLNQICKNKILLK